MSSSFRPAGSGGAAVPRTLPGTRGWLHGVRLTSTGHASVDGLVGGGVPLGGLVLLEHDGLQAEAHAATLASVFAAQGVGLEHAVMVLGIDGAGVPSVAGFVAAFPFNLTTSSTRVPTGATKEPAAATPPDTSLKIAWQYDKYMGAKGAGLGSELMGGEAMPRHPPAAPSSSSSPSTSSKFCHTFDLGRSAPVGDAVATPDVMVGEDPHAVALRCVHDHITAAKEGGQAARVVVLSPGGALWSADSGRVCRFLGSLRALLRDSNAVGLVTLSAEELPPHVVVRARHAAHVSLNVLAFADRDSGAPPEFADWHGTLTAQSLSRMHCLAAHNPDTLDLLYKRDLHKLKMEKLHLPPEQSRTTDSAKLAKAAGGAGGTALQAGMACATTGGRPTIDF